MKFRWVLKTTTAKYFGSSLTVVRPYYFTGKICLLKSLQHMQILFIWNYSGQRTMRVFRGFIRIRNRER